MGQNTFLSGKNIYKNTWRTVWMKMCSHCQIESGNAAGFPLIFRLKNSPYARKKARCWKWNSSQAGADKAAALGECIVSLEIRCGEPNQIVWAEIEFHATQERKREPLSFASEEEKNPFHAWLQPAHLNVWWCVKSKFMLTFHSHQREGCFSAAAGDGIPKEMRAGFLLPFSILKAGFYGAWKSMNLIFLFSRQILTQKTYRRRMCSCIWWLTYALGVWDEKFHIYLACKQCHVYKVVGVNSSSQ